MSIPRQVEEQVKKAEEALAQKPTELQSEVAEESMPQPETTGETKEEATALFAGEQSQQDGRELSLDEYKKLEQKYKTLQGKYDAEVPRLSAEIRRLRQLIEVLNKEELQKMPDEELDISEIVDKETLDNFGEDLIKTTAKIGKKIARTEVEDLRKKLDQIEFDLFIEKVKSRVPNFDEVNSDPAFIQWMQNTVDVMGDPLIKQFNEYASLRDVDGVVRFFNQWNTMKKGAVANNATTISPLPSTMSSQNIQSTGKKVYKTSEIMKITTNITRGLYSKETARKLQEEIDQAISEGRVVKG